MARRDLQFDSAKKQVGVKKSGLDINQVVNFMLENNIESLKLIVGDKRPDGLRSVKYVKTVFDPKQKTT